MGCSSCARRVLACFLKMQLSIIVVLMLLYVLEGSSVSGSYLVMSFCCNTAYLLASLCLLDYVLLAQVPCPLCHMWLHFAKDVGLAPHPATLASLASFFFVDLTVVRLTSDVVSTRCCDGHNKLPINRFMIHGPQDGQR